LQTACGVVLDVQVTATLDSAQVQLRGLVRQHDGQQRVCIQALALPNFERLVLRSPQTDTLFTPWFFGHVGDLADECGAGNCGLDLWRFPIMDGELPLMPNGNERSMQWAALYSTTANTTSDATSASAPLGLYVGAHSADADLMMMLMMGGYCPQPQPLGDCGSYAGLRWLHLPQNLLDNSSSVWIMDYAVVLAGFEGDWYDAAQVYRAWALPHARWTRAGNISTRLAAAEYPAWLTGVPLWTTDWLTHSEQHQQRATPRSDDESGLMVRDNIALAAALGTPIATHVYGWQVEPFGVGVPYYTPHPNFATEVAALAAADVHVIPYTSGRLFNPTLPEWQSDDAERFACHRFGGAPFSEKYEAGLNWSFAVMDPATAYWQRTIAGVAANIVNETNVSGIYIDQIASYYAEACYTNNSRHGRGASSGGGSAWAAGNRGVLESLSQSIGPQKVVISESNAEAYLGSLHAYLALYGWGRCDMVSAFQAVYGGWSTNVGAMAWPVDSARTVSINATSRRESFRALFAQQWIVGHVLGWLSPTAILTFMSAPADRAYLRSLVQLRLKYAKFLVHGRMMRPPTIAAAARQSAELPTVQMCMVGQVLGQVLCCPQLAVVGSAWLADDGILGVALANTIDVPVSFIVTLQVDAHVPFRANDSVVIVRNGGRGNTTIVRAGGLEMSLTLAALSATVVMVSVVRAVAGAPLQMQPLGVYCGSAGAVCVETTPIIWQGKLAVVEHHQPFRVRWQSHDGLPSAITTGNNSKIVDIPDTDWLQFSSSTVVGETLWVFGTNDVEAVPPRPSGKPRTQVHVHWSSDPGLRADSWRTTRVLQLPQNGTTPTDPLAPRPWWEACNTSPTKGQVGGMDAFVLAIEIDSPQSIVPSSRRGAQYASVFAVCFQCASMGDLSFGWEVLDPLTHIYRRDTYSAAPTLRWFDNWFYIIVLVKHEHRPGDAGGAHCHTRFAKWDGCLVQHVARSRDLATWVESPFGSPPGHLMGWPDGNNTLGSDHRIIRGSLLDKQGGVLVKQLAANMTDDINRSDMDMVTITLPGGERVTYVVWLTGNQAVPSGHNLPAAFNAAGLVNGSEQDWLESWF
jgi:hypothetical protein